MARDRQIEKDGLQLFLSYSSAKNKLAGELKKELETYGVNCFIAHQDIAPSQAWQNTIIGKLQTCDAVIPILTKEFHASYWTDQECGIALALDKFILPLGYYGDPHGFLARFQSLKVHRGATIPKTANRIVVSLSEQKPLRKRLRSSLIVALRRSHSFAESNEFSKILVSLSPFSEQQVEAILRSSFHNDQVSKASLTVENIGNILRDNPSRGSTVVVKRFQKLTGWSY